MEDTSGNHGKSNNCLLTCTGALFVTALGCTKFHRNC